MEASFADNKYLQAANMQPSATCVKPKQGTVLNYYMS